MARPAEPRRGWGAEESGVLHQPGLEATLTFSHASVTGD